MSDLVQYFAYSPILDPAHLAEWKRQHRREGLTLPEGELAELRGLDLVFNLPSTRWGGRIAGLRPREGASVLGRLYSIPRADWPLIQEAEGARSGKFVELPVQAQVGGRSVAAVAFTSNPKLASSQGPVSEAYAEALAAAAKAARLPAPYVERLEAESLILKRVQAVGRELNLQK